MDSSHEGKIMNVNVYECGTETWVHVLSNEIEDWPTVRDSLPAEQRAKMQGRPRYFPHVVKPAEYAEHGYLFGDFWTFGVAADPSREWWLFGMGHRE